MPSRIGSRRPFLPFDICMMRPVSWPQMLHLARRYNRSAYDVAYLALAEATGQPLITGDRRLYQAVRNELGWVRWLGSVGRET